MANLYLLGPQRHQITVGATLDSQDIEGPLAVITAGWQERELEMEELDAAVSRDTINLKLHKRTEEVYQTDPSFRTLHRAHQDRLKRLQVIYRGRLDHTLGSVFELMKTRDNFAAELIEPEIEDAFEAVRRLDEHHLQRLQQLNDDFLSDHSATVRAAILDQNHELEEIIERCGCVLIAGGHVAVLLNRLRLLNLAPLMAEKPVIAWSAGAMVLGSKVVLFHDSPPQGRGYAEVFENGLGLYQNLLPLPHAGKRLQLDNAVRVAVFAQRFDDAHCLTLGNQSRVDWDGENWRAVSNIGRLMPDGSCESKEDTCL